MNWLKYEIKEKIDQLEVTFATVFEDFEHHLQEEILGCKGKDNPDVTKLRNEIKQLKPKNDKLKKEAYEKDSITKTVRDTAASIDKSGWQTEYRKSKYISNQTNKPLKTVNSFLPLQENGM